MRGWIALGIVVAAWLALICWLVVSWPVAAQERAIVAADLPEGWTGSVRLYGALRNGAALRRDPDRIADGRAYYDTPPEAEIGGLVACNERYEKRACGERWVSPAWTNLPEPGTTGILASVLLLIGLRRRKKAPGG